METRLYSAREVASRTRRRTETVLEWLKTGELAATRTGGRGGRWYVHPADLEEFLRDRARSEARERREATAKQAV